MNRTAVSPAPGSGQLRRRVGRLVRAPRGVALMVVLLFLIFEVGIRHVPPDGMTVTGIEDSEVGYPDTFGTTVAFTASYTAPEDQQTINDFYASLNAAPAYFSPVSHPIVNCALTPLPYATSITFTWHGMPLETWFTSSCVVGDTAGGIPDVLTYRLWGPQTLPPPAPA